MPNDDTPPQTEVDANPGLIPSSVRAEDNLGLFSFSFDNLSWQPPDMSVATLQDITDDSIEIQTPPGSDDDDSFADLYARLLDDDEPTVPYPDESWVEMDELSFISDAPTFPYGSFLSLFDPNNLGTIIAGAAEQANYDVMMAMNSMDLSSITELSVRLMLVSVVLELRDKARVSGPAATFEEWGTRRISQFNGVYLKASTEEVFSVTGLMPDRESTFRLVSIALQATFDGRDCDQPWPGSQDIEYDLAELGNYAPSS